MRIIIDETRCVGCGQCLDVCPQGAISLVGGKASIVVKRCNACGACMDACPDEAIRQQVPQGRLSTFQKSPFAPSPSLSMRMPALLGRRSARRFRRRRGWTSLRKAAQQVQNAERR